MQSNDPASSLRPMWTPVCGCHEFIPEGISVCGTCGMPFRFRGWLDFGPPDGDFVFFPGRRRGARTAGPRPDPRWIEALRVRCVPCRGTGYRMDPSAPHPCPACEGAGAFWQATEAEIDAAIRRFTASGGVFEAPPGASRFPLVDPWMLGGDAPGDPIPLLRPRLRREAQKVVDDCLALLHDTGEILASRPTLQEELRGIDDLVARHHPEMNLSQSRWKGFHGHVILDGAVKLKPLMERTARARHRPPNGALRSPLGRVRFFRWLWGGAFRQGHVFHAYRLRGAEHRTGWLGFLQKGEEPAELVGVFASPGALETRATMQDWVFGMNETAHPADPPTLERPLPRGDRYARTDLEILSELLWQTESWLRR